MDELLKQLFAAEVLTEDTRTALTEAIQQQIAVATEAARAEATATVTAELNERWLRDREILVDALDAKVTEVLAEELAEFKNDAYAFRDLDAEQVVKIAEAKADMAVQVKEDMAQLIVKLDTFLTARLESEFAELNENIIEIRKNDFGRKVFESFVAEFKKHYAGDDSIEGKLTETEQRLEDTTATLQEAQQRVADLERSIAMTTVLAPLSGRTRDVMEAILKPVVTAKLAEAYQTFIGRVLRETSSSDGNKTSEKEAPVLAEDVNKEEIRGVVKSGDDKVKLDESAAIAKNEDQAKPQPVLSTKSIEHLQRLAGIK